jgi:hypothetical protein
MLASSRKLLQLKHCRVGRNGKLMLSSNRGILSEEEQAGGKRKIEIDEEKQSRIAFDQSAIIPEPKAGTKENPILVSIT